MYQKTHQITCFHRVLTTPASSVHAVHRLQDCPGPAGRPRRLARWAGLPEHAHVVAPSMHLRAFPGGLGLSCPEAIRGSRRWPGVRTYMRLGALRPLRTREEPAHPRACRTAPPPLVRLVPQIGSALRPAPRSCLSNPRAVSWGRGSASHTALHPWAVTAGSQNSYRAPGGPSSQVPHNRKVRLVHPEPGRPHSKPFLTLHIITEESLQALGVDFPIPSIRPS